MNDATNESRVKILYRGCNKNYHFVTCNIAQIIFPQKLAPRRTPKTGPLTGVPGLNVATHVETCTIIVLLINTTSKLGLPSHTLLKINTARFEKTGRRPEAPQQATHRDNKGARGFGQSRRLWEVFERGRKGRKDLELLIWELALRFEPHNTSCRSPPSHARIGHGGDLPRESRSRARTACSREATPRLADSTSST